MAGYEPRKELSKQPKKAPYIAGADALTKGLVAAVTPPPLGGNQQLGVYAPQQPIAPGTPIPSGGILGEQPGGPPPLQAPNIPVGASAEAPNIPVGASAEQMAAQTNALASAQPKPLQRQAPGPLGKIADSVNPAPQMPAPALTQAQAPTQPVPALGGFARMGNQEYRIGPNGQAEKFVNGQSVGDPAQASFTADDVAKGRAADDARLAADSVKNDQFRRDTAYQADASRAIRATDPEQRAVLTKVASDKYAAGEQGVQKRAEGEAEVGKVSAAMAGNRAVEEIKGKNKQREDQRKAENDSALQTQKDAAELERVQFAAQQQPHVKAIPLYGADLAQTPFMYDDRTGQPPPLAGRQAPTTADYPALAQSAAPYRMPPIEQTPYDPRTYDRIGKQVELHGKDAVNAFLKSRGQPVLP